MPRTALPLLVALMVSVSVFSVSAGTAAAQDDEGDGGDYMGEADGDGDERDAPPTNRPTSGDLSIFSGRTTSNGDTVLAAGVGWPSIWAGIWLAPSSKLSIGIQGHVYYGSPIMGFSVGAGFGLVIPLRLHVYGKGNFDLSIFLEPGAVFGEGALVGQIGAFGGAFGYGVYGTGGALAGLQLSDVVTLSFGVGGQAGYVHTPERNIEPASPIGAILVNAGLEALMSRDTMLFGQVRGGIGFSNDTTFQDGRGVFQGTLGFAYLL